MPGGLPVWSGSTAFTFFSVLNQKLQKNPTPIRMTIMNRAKFHHLLFYASVCFLLC